jgi:hypothetical protein
MDCQQNPALVALELEVCQQSKKPEREVEKWVTLNTKSRRTKLC